MEKDLQFDLVDIPEDYCCPITLELMENPVLAADGFSYERRAIETWLTGGKKISPMTGTLLKHITLHPNHTLKSIIDRFRADLPKIQQKKLTENDIQLAIQLKEQEINALLAKQKAKIEQGQQEKAQLQKRLQDIENPSTQALSSATKMFQKLDIAPGLIPQEKDKIGVKVDNSHYQLQSYILNNTQVYLLKNLTWDKWLILNQDHNLQIWDASLGAYLETIALYPGTLPYIEQIKNIILHKLDNDHCTIRTIAIGALGKLGDNSKNIIDALVEEVKEERLGDRGVRSVAAAAANALIKLGYNHKSIFNILRNVIRDFLDIAPNGKYWYNISYRNVCDAIKVLSKLTAERSTVKRYLLELLENDNDYISSAVFASLAQLINVTDDDIIIAFAKRYIRENHHDSLITLIKLSEERPAILCALATIQQQQPQRQQLFERPLYVVNGVEFSEKLCLSNDEAIQNCIGYLATSSSWKSLEIGVVRSAIIKLIANSKFKPTDFNNLLIRIFHNDTNIEVVKVAADFLIKYKVDESKLVNSLLQQLGQCKFVGDHAAVIEHLSCLKGISKTFSHNLIHLLDEERVGIRAAAMRALMEIGDESAKFIQYFIACLHNYHNYGATEDRTVNAIIKKISWSKESSINRLINFVLSQHAEEKLIMELLPWLERFISKFNQVKIMFNKLLQHNSANIKINAAIILAKAGVNNQQVIDTAMGALHNYDSVHGKLEHTVMILADLFGNNRHKIKILTKIHRINEGKFHLFTGDILLKINFSLNFFKSWFNEQHNRSDEYGRRNISMNGIKILNNICHMVKRLPELQLNPITLFNTLHKIEETSHISQKNQDDNLPEEANRNTFF